MTKAELLKISAGFFGLDPSLWWVRGLWYIVLSFVVILPVLGAAAYLTYGERKVLGRLQYRISINVTGIFGLLQPLADGLKMFLKEMIIPKKAVKAVFLGAPFLAFICALVSWGLIPFGQGIVLADIDVGVLFIMAISSLNVLTILMAGWGSASRYAYLGAMRGASQMISYELSMTTCLVGVVMIGGSLNLTELVVAQQNSVWFGLPLFPLMVIFFICILAETNRTPFDIPEGEAEIIAGHLIEYTGLSFAFFYLAEYANMILMSFFLVLLFLGGWLPPYPVLSPGILEGFFWLFFKTAAVLFLFLWIRGTLPGYRPDQLMRLGWKILLPLSMVLVVAEAVILYAYHVWGT